jgi:hypothetical protein
VEHLPPFVEVRRNLVSDLYGLAHALNCLIRPGAGASLLGLPPDIPMSDWPSLDDFALSKIEVANQLERIYRYASDAELDCGILPNAQDHFGENGDLGQLRDLLALIDGCEVIDPDWIEELFADNKPCRGLRQMVRLADARWAIDNEKTVSLADIAILAAMDERSVRNALHATGAANLAAVRNHSGELVAERAEALRWLRLRRGFKESIRVGGMNQAELPETLAADEIVPFIVARIEAIHSPGIPLERDWHYANAGNVVGWPEERVLALATGNLNDIAPDDCPAISRMLAVDTRWFTAQVMRARFPDAMQELAPAGHQAPAPLPVSRLDEAAGTLDSVLTEAGIRNGYFDIEARYSRFFPSESRGGRGADHHGVQFRLAFDETTVMTDLRVRSASKLSLRKRLTAYFNRHKVKPGDLVRLQHLGENSYQMSHIPQ